MDKPNTIRIKPISVKFVSTSVGERKYEIWEYNPYTNEEGTLVPYDDAIQILVNIPNIVTTCSTLVDGEYVSSVSDDIINEIKLKIEEKRMGLGTHISVPDSKPAQNVTGAVSSLLESQSKIIETQSAQMAEMQKQMSEMQKQMATLLASTSKK